MKTTTMILSAVITIALLSPLADAQIFYGAPPAGFNPVTASDAERDLYGIPPHPDQSQPELYADWVKMVTAPQTRLINPKVETTNYINGPLRGRQDQGYTASAVSSTSENWSGYAVSVANGTFTKNDSEVFSKYTMPAIGVDNCSYKPYYMAEWVGFDGAFDDDVLQAGTLSTACSTTYAAWYEWYEDGCTSSSASHPCYITTVSLAVNPGDLIYVEVWVYNRRAERPCLHPELHYWKLRFSRIQPTHWYRDL